MERYPTIDPNLYLTKNDIPIAGQTPQNGGLRIPEFVVMQTNVDLGDLIAREFDLTDPPVESVRLTARNSLKSHGVMWALQPHYWDPREGIVLGDETMVEVIFTGLPPATYIFSATFWTLEGGIQAYGPWGSTTAEVFSREQPGTVMAMTVLSDTSDLTARISPTRGSEYYIWILSAQLARV